MQDSHSQVDLEMLTEAADVNGIYEEALEHLKTRKPAVEKKPGIKPTIAEREQAAKDYYANVRTNVRHTNQYLFSSVRLHSLGIVDMGSVQCMFRQVFIWL